MRNHIKLFYFFLFSLSILRAQTNLVPNSSFELYDTCPYNQSKINFAIPWFDPIQTTSDFAHQCNGGLTQPLPGTWGGVPYNFWGHQYAKTGLGYAGLGTLCYLCAQDMREYISVRLTDSLIAGKKYCASFYVSLADTSLYATDMIGAYFSVNTPCCGNPFILQFNPQIENTVGNILNDTVNWVLISGSFIATGGESFLTIGNFKNDLNTLVDTLTHVNSYYPAAYYYIDDVSVYCCDDDSCTSNGTINIPNVFTPNYDRVNDMFEITGLQKGDKVQIYNRWGTLVFETESEKMFWDGYTTSGEPCTDGVYFYVVTLQIGESKRGYLTLIK